MWVTGTFSITHETERSDVPLFSPTEHRKGKKGRDQTNGEGEEVIWMEGGV